MLWTIAHQAPLTWDSPGKNTSVSCHALLQGIYSGIEPISLISLALAGGFFTTSTTWEAPQNAVDGCNIKNYKMILVYSQGKPFKIMIIQVSTLTNNAK